MSKTFCILPFVHLATHPNGDVTPCCDSSTFYPTNGDDKLSLNTHTIDEIRNSKSFKELRKSMLDGEQHHACKYCWDMENKGILSRRERENDSYGINEITKKYFIDKLPLLNVELRLGNICNMKCLICHPHSSSKWNEDSDAIQKSDFRIYYGDWDLYSKKIIEREWYRDSRFYTQLIENYSDLNHLWINGGEPTLIKEHYTFLKQLVSNKKSKNITLDYNVNGSNIPNELIEIWKEFKFVSVTVSMDDIGDRIYYQRYPTKFDNVKSTIKKLEDNDIIYTIIPTISLYNIYNIVNILKYIKENFKKGNEPGLNFVYHPFHLTISNLPDSQKKKIENVIKSSFLHEDDKSSILFELNKKGTHDIKVFKRFTEILDKKRNVNILDYLPEYKWLFSNQMII